MRSLHGEGFRKLKNGVKRTLAKSELYEKANRVGCAFMPVVFCFVEDGCFDFSCVRIIDSWLFVGNSRRCQHATLNLFQL